MKEQAPQIRPLVTYSAEEREAFSAKEMSKKEIDDLEQKKNALLRDSREEKIRERALKSLQDSLDS